MVGKLFAMTAESAAIKRQASSTPYGLEAKFRGQASEDFQIDFYGGLKESTVPEGIDFWERLAAAQESSSAYCSEDCAAASPTAEHEH